MQEQAVKPGFGRFGILEEDEGGRVMCHLCGRWFKKLGPHVVAGHGMNVMDYRDAFGLKHGRGLMSDKYREPIRQHGLRMAAAGKSNPPLASEGWRSAAATVVELNANRAWREQRYPDTSIAINCVICGAERTIPFHRRHNYKTCGNEQCQRELNSRQHKKGSR